MNSYSRRRRRRGGAGGILLIMLLAAAAALAVFLLRGGETPGGAALTDDTAQAGDAAPAGGQETAPAEDSEPQAVQASTGVSCTLTDLGEEAIYTGELVLVNNWTLYHFPENQELVSVYEEKNDSYYVGGTNIYLEHVAMEALNALLGDFTAQGGSKSVNVVAGHRTKEFQQHLFDQSAERNGLEHAQQYVAQPGGSEHHTGLVVDLNIYHDDGTSEEYRGTGEYAWINDNCQNYGYVVRYATDKADLTGIADEPWHFRYVGIPHATQMVREGLCLEEYIDYLRDYTAEGEHLMISCVAGTYEVWYAEGSSLYLPDSGEYTVSGNNVDGLIVTCKVG